MNFTREPIIETIISPKEGFKLLVRSSKGGGSEEFFVDAVEVVSFGRGSFFRSLERPKAFLVPVSDYEILEVKETRVALKNVSHERNIKIGGGREAPLRHHPREQAHEKERESEAMSAEEEDQQPTTAEESGVETGSNSRLEKRRERRRRRHRRSSDDQDWTERRPQERSEQQQEGEQKAQGGGAEDEAKVSSPMFSSLIPPPPTLISETLSRYKDKEFAEGAHHKEKELEKQKEEKKKQTPPEEESSGSESSPLNRVAPVSVMETLEVSTFTSTNFSTLPNNDPYSY